MKQLLKKYIEHLYFLLFFNFISINLFSQKNDTSYFTLKGKPWQLVSYNSIGEYKLDKNGQTKAAKAIKEPFFIGLGNPFIHKNTFKAFINKNRKYVITETDSAILISCEDDSLIFNNEFQIINSLDQEFAIRPFLNTIEISDDSSGNTEQLFTDIITSLTVQKKDVQGKLNNFGWSFDKPVRNEEEYFELIEYHFKKRSNSIEDAYTNKKISSEFYTYFKTYFYLRYLLDIVQVSKNGKQLLNKKTKPKIEKAFGELGQLFKKDEYLNYSDFNDLLQAYLQHKLYKDYNYRTINEEKYDYIVNENKFSEKIKNHLLNYIIQNKVFKCKNYIYDNYLNKFLKDCKDTFYTNNIKREIEEKNSFFDDKILNNSLLVTTNYKLISIKNFLNKYKGKTIYIDFWASWCIPCRKEFEYSKKIEKAVEGKDFVVIYVSIDSKNENWIKAVEDEKLNKNNSYLLSGSSQNELYKKLNIQSIPRYVIIDKNGKLKEKDALYPYSMYDKKFYE